MKFRIKYADQVVGVFILLALVLVVAALFFIALNQRWFTHNAIFKSVFNSASSITVGNAITLRGFEIGKISKMGLNKDNLVDIEFVIYNEYLSKVTMNSLLEVSSSPIGLGTSVIFHKGKSSQPLHELDLVPAFDSDKGRAMVDAGLVDIPKKDDTISALLAQVRSVMDNLDTTIMQLKDINAGGKPGPIRDLLNQLNGVQTTAQKGPIRLVLDSANGTLSSVTQTMDWAQGSFGPVVGQVGVTLDNLNSALPAVVAQLNDVLADVQAMTETLKDTNGLVPRLLGDPALMPNIEVMISSLNASLAQVQSMVTGLNAEVPKLSSTITEVRGAIASAMDVMEGLKNNPLLKGGITEKPQQTAIFQSLRREEF